MLTEKLLPFIGEAHPILVVERDPNLCWIATMKQF